MHGRSHRTATILRRLVGVALIACAAAAATMAIGSTLAARSTAAKSPLAGLDRTFRSLQPDARCAAGGDRATRAKRLRAAALKGAAEAPPKVLKRKKASMRRAIGLLREAGDLCEAAAPPTGGPGGGGTPAPSPGPYPAPGPAPTPVPPGTTTIALTASNFAFSPGTPAIISVGGLRLELTNPTGTTHRVGVRTSPGLSLIQQSPIAPGGGSAFAEIPLGAGSYQIFCGVGTHAEQGMVVPLTVTP